MCGIFGVIGRRGRVDAAQLAQAATGRMRHRGPDSQGTYTETAGEWAVGLAHRRLAIVDLSPTGEQPMHTADGVWHLVYNGEVYNNPALREEFGDRYPFRGTSDTETILAGMATAGPDYGQKLRGMFAYGAVNSRERVLRLARDPLGIKPLYYYEGEDVFVFASEVRTILGTGLGRWRMEPRAVEAYLTTGSASDPETVVRGIRALEAGQELEVDYGGDRLRTRRVERPERWTGGGTAPRRREEAVEGLREALRESVRGHLLADVPVGLFLSGGIDSSALLALMTETGGGAARTFTVSFGESRFSEAKQAREIAGMYGAEHHEIELTEEGLRAELPRALAAMDQPSVDGVNSYIVSKAVRDAGLKVALSGLGGDELFAGYPSFVRQAKLARAGVAARAAGLAAKAAGRVAGRRGVVWEKAGELLASGGAPEQVYAVTRRLFPPGDVARLLSRPGGGRGAARAPFADGTNAMSYLELTGYMRNTLLRDCDAMSMAHSLEIRVPFVDVDVARYVLGLPGSWKLDGKRPKSLLLDAMGERVPDYVWNRPKMGFTLPFADWMLAGLREPITAALEDREAMEACGVRREEAGRIWREFTVAPGRWRWSRPWSLYVLARWTKENGVTV